MKSVFYRCLSTFFTIFTVLIFTPVGAIAKSDRIALVIGVSDYDQTIKLANPERDATGVATALESVGFDTTLLLNTNLNEFGQGLLDFEQKLDGAKVALFYFAGHGIQIGQKNYLLSKDAKVKNAHLIDQDGFALDRILKLMEARAELAIALVDACRDNPLANAMIKNSGATARSTLGLNRGLAPIQNKAQNTLVAFATAPGAIALDGDVRSNSPFASALIKHMVQPDIEVSTMLKRVTFDVLDSTKGKQRPEVVTSMAREFYFAKRDEQADQSTSKFETEFQATELLKSARTMPRGKPRVSALEIIIKNYPETVASELAKVMLDQELASNKFLAKERTQTTFDRSKLSALDVDAALAQGQSQVFATETPEDIEASLALEKSDIARIQVAMNAMGYQVGTADGVFGKKSRQALKKLQVRQKVAQTGYLNNETVNAILKEFADAPKTFDGDWQLVVSRIWTRDTPDGNAKKGTREALAYLDLKHQNDDFDIQKFTYNMRLHSQDAFSNFTMSSNKNGQISIRTDINTLSPSAKRLRPKTENLRARYNLPKIVPVGAKFEFNGNVVESGYIQLNLQLTRTK